MGRQRIYIVEDHPIVRIGYQTLIQTTPDLEVCGESSTATIALKEIETLRPDLIIIDIALPGMNGIELTSRLNELYPDLKMLIVSMHEESLYAETAIRAGARGYVMKQANDFEIIRAIREVLNGKLYVSQKVLERVVLRHFAQSPSSEYKTTSLEGLTDRESEVLKLLGSGQTTKKIAAKMSISPKTVETYYASIREKLGLENISELVRFAAVHFG